jgi:hypothetical protein
MDNRETGMGEANVPLRLKERNCIGEKLLRLCGTLLLLERKVVEARGVENCEVCFCWLLKGHARQFWR